MGKAKTADKKPLSELASATKTANSELKKAVTAFQTRVQKRSAAGGNGAPKKRARTSEAVFILDGAMDLAKDAPSLQSEAIAEDAMILNQQMDRPYIISGSADCKQLFKTTALSAATNQFSLAFSEKVKKAGSFICRAWGCSCLFLFSGKEERARAAQPPDSRTKTRAASQLSSEAGAEALEALKSMFPRHAINAISSAGVYVGHFGVQGFGPRFWLRSILFFWLEHASNWGRWLS